MKSGKEIRNYLKKHQKLPATFFNCGWNCRVCGHTTGHSLIKSGEEVKKGQELISGIVNITDDSQEVVRYEYVQADADVYVRYTIDYYDTFPLTIEKKFTGKKKTEFLSEIKTGSGSVSCCEEE